MAAYQNCFQDRRECIYDGIKIRQVADEGF